jgi:hypothetical protein
MARHYSAAAHGTIVRRASQPVSVRKFREQFGIDLQNSVMK